MRKKCSLNESFFETIDTEAKAYFLGLLFSDGNIYMKRKRVQLTLSNEDVYIIEAFSKAIEYKGKLYTDRGKYTKIILPSEKMCQDLIKLGCTPKKSLTLKFPTEIPNYLLHHFIRGCFDGDGHVSKRRNTFNINFTSSYDFITGFLNLLNDLEILHTGSKKRYESHEKSAYQVYIKTCSGRKFLDYIYKDSTFYLTRKKNISDLPSVPILRKWSDKRFL